MEEKWKDIPGYEGLYQASNLGNIRSVTRVHRYIKKGKLCFRTRLGHTLSPNINNHGYLYLCLCKNKHRWYAKVHRLVAITFLSNPNNFTDVNHKDGNKKNNIIENLEWCSHSENQKHAIRHGLNMKPYAAGLYKKAILQINPDTKEVVAEYESIAAANDHFGRCKRSNISNVLNGHHRLAYGYEWQIKK